MERFGANTVIISWWKLESEKVIFKIRSGGFTGTVNSICSLSIVCH